VTDAGTSALRSVQQKNPASPGFVVRIQPSVGLGEGIEWGMPG